MSASDPADDPTYSSLPALRRALTDDDPDDRANAYGAVMSADVQPSQVLATPPDDAAIATLEEAGVLPTDAAEGNIGTQEYRRRVLDALESDDGGSA